MHKAGFCAPHLNRWRDVVANHGGTCERASMSPTSPKAVAKGYLISAVSMSVVGGMFLIQGLENALRGNPAYWIQFVAAPAFLAVAIVLCRKVVRAIPSDPVA